MIRNSTDKLLGKYISVGEGIYYTILDGKATILRQKRNLFYTLNPLGKKIWELADGSRTIREIAAVICKEFNVDKYTAVRDILKFLKDLTKINLPCLLKEGKKY